MKLRLFFLAGFLIWCSTTLLTLTAVFLFLSYRETVVRNQNAKTTVLASESSYYHLYTSRPKVLGETFFSVTTQDGVPVMIKRYLDKYNSPMLNSADALINIAKKYEIDPFLLIAIAQCESNLGKKMPEDCHNPFGWGIHSAGTLCFETWEEGYEKVASGLKEKYIDKGLVTPPEIMRKYNLTSLENADGSWARCVDKFLEEIQSLK